MGTDVGPFISIKGVPASTSQIRLPVIGREENQVVCIPQLSRVDLEPFFAWSGRMVQMIRGFVLVVFNNLEFPLFHYFHLIWKIASERLCKKIY